ncbi:MAG: hypothetical protein HGA45_16280 [Chloroflexales bacterium]|nr:hypothetical protein [Chloroflexales bacterium]
MGQKRIAEAQVVGVVQTELQALATSNGATTWVVAALWVDRAAWQTMLERLAWQVYVTKVVKPFCA